jgi:hypothetical protein
VSIFKVIGVRRCIVFIFPSLDKHDDWPMRFEVLLKVAQSQVLMNLG